MMKRMSIVCLALCIFGAIASADPGIPPVILPTVQIPVTPPAISSDDTWMLHLPGIAGRRSIDDQLARGLRDGGFGGALDIYDWTGDDPGLGALLAYKRNQAEAQKVADLIADRFHKHPQLHIILTGHSGGTGVAIWALEKLPEDVKVDKVILLASALSPGYDLSKALTHVRGKCYSFCSENDILVLGIGTRAFGTIDGKKTEAAGEGGFIYPDTADARQYEKLIQKPYDKSWLQYHNVGDHIGCMLRPFSRHVIAPLVVRQEK